MQPPQKRSMLCASTNVPEHREILFLLTKPLLPKMQKPLTSVESRLQPHPAASLVLTKTKRPRERERAIFLQRLLQRRKQKNTPPQHLLDPPGSNPFPILPLQRNEREREEKKPPHSRHHMSQCDKSRNPKRRHQAEPPPGLLQAEISTTKGAVESRSNASRTSQISKNRSLTHQSMRKPIKEKRTKHKKPRRTRAHEREKE